MTSQYTPPQNIHDILPMLMFEAVYGRQPTEIEVDKLRSYAEVMGATTLPKFLRATVTSFDRFNHPTPVSVRFTENDLGKVTIIESEEKLVLDRHDFSVSNTILGTGNYENHLRRFISAIVKPGMVCVDIGENVGFHAFLMRELTGPTGHIYAFEPNSENCRMLMLSKKENLADNFTVLPVALSDRLGAIAFSPAVGSNGSFMYGVDGDPILHPNCTIVPTARMDDLLKVERLDFIKIDVEGAEPLALAGGEDLITRHRPVITSEFSAAMIELVSGTNGVDYLARRMRDNYRAFTLGCSGPLEEITDAEIFMRNWHDKFRIEDIAFVPCELDFDFEAYSARA